MFFGFVYRCRAALCFSLEVSLVFAVLFRFFVVSWEGVFPYVFFLQLVVKLISGPETLKRCRGERHLLVLLLPLLLLPLLVLLLLMLLLLQALRSSFLGSPEFAAGAAAVDASKVGDNVRLAEALEAPVFRLLLPPVAALAAQRAAAVRCCSGANSSREFNEIGFSGEAIDLLLMSETQALNPTP